MKVQANLNLPSEAFSKTIKERKMKKIVFLLAVCALCMGQIAYAEGPKIGVVDLIRSLNESDAGKKAKTELEGLIKSKQTSIDEKGKEIEKLKGELEKQASILSSEARKSKEDELEKLLREYQRLVTDAQNDVKKREGEYTGEIVKELRMIIEKIGTDEGFTMIIENAEGIILFSKKELDLTEKVIKKHNETKGKSKNKK
jgi:outer membrane protein